VARFYGVVGFGTPTESPANSGVWKDVITEKTYSGDVIRDTRRFDGSQKVNADISVGNSISVVADAYLTGNVQAIRYVAWTGTLWTVDSVEVQSPRLILRLGGVYSGPTPV
jgi:hypothetical protein